MSEELASVVLAERSLLVDELPEVSVGTVLHDLEDAVPVQDGLVEPHYVVVSEPLRGQRLSDDLLVQHHVAPGATAERLDGHVDSSTEVVGQLHFSELSVADGRAQ